MWIELKGRQHRVYWRTHAPAPAPQKDYEPFGTRDQAESFIELNRAAVRRGLARAAACEGARDYVRNPSPERLAELLGVGVIRVPARGAATRPTGPSSCQDSRLTGVTFDHLWETFIARQRQLEEGTVELYEGYYRNHFSPFFGTTDIGLIQRHRPLRHTAACEDVLYVDDGFVAEMFRKPKLNNAGAPRPGTHLTIKFIDNVLTVLGQVFDFAVQERDVPFEINPAHGIQLPKQDRREMHFLRDRNAYLALRCAMHAHFVTLLDFLVGTGARYGEAAGLLARHVHLDGERPHVEIRLALKWRGKKFKLGRPKTKSSVRRIDLSPTLVEVLRPLLAGRAPDEHVFTMVEGGPLHHGNFYNRYFKPAAQAAGAAVPRGIRIHDLRHTHAAWLLSAGISIYIVSRRLGHSSTATTTEVYGHLTPEAMDGVLQAVDRMLPDILDLDADRLEATVLPLTAREKALPEFDIDDYDDLAA